MCKTTMKLGAYKNSMTPKTSQCSNASTNSLYLSTSKTIEEIDTPISTKLLSNSPYHPVEKHIKTHSREQNILPTEDGLTTDARTI